MPFIFSIFVYIQARWVDDEQIDKQTDSFGLARKQEEEEEGRQSAF